MCACQSVVDTYSKYYEHFALPPSHTLGKSLLITAVPVTACIINCNFITYIEILKIFKLMAIYFGIRLHQMKRIPPQVAIYYRHQNYKCHISGHLAPSFDCVVICAHSLHGHMICDAYFMARIWTIMLANDIGS